MQKLSKLYFLFFFIFFLFPIKTFAQQPFPKIKLPCDESRDIEFHSLRPYQAAHCGDANKALYCSNDLKFLETFDVTGMGDCVEQGISGTFLCNPNFTVEPHTLIVKLDDSMFPIMGNTEEVKNSQSNEDTYDDATKVNEYASWYLSGVNNRAEYGKNTNERIINFSGPIQKLIPKTIQESERIKTINKAVIDTDEWTDPDDNITYTTPQNHDQIVVCGEKDELLSFVNIGITKPKPCYNAKEYRLSDWLGDLSDFNSFFNRIGAEIWNKRIPPLPWDDGTVKNPTKDKPAKPFQSQALYEKAYREWRGESCALVPYININLCIDNPFVPNKWAELYNYIPLSNTTDKKGQEYITDVQPAPVGGTQIGKFEYGTVKNAPLYFAHTQEVKESVELLNKTFTPLDCPVDKNGKRIENEECKTLSNKRGQAVESNNCSAVNVRINKGDNLFPGDPDEMQVPDITYPITQAKCKEVERERTYCGRPNKCGGSYDCCTITESKLECIAQIYITIKTKTKTPNATEIFNETVAGTGSTFRKIFPKVEENAPVSCIADMPTVTNVTYDTNGSQPPAGGDLEFTGVIKYPEDGTGSSPQLTFPHIGSIYEYFLKGIQTAIRPKGYGEPIVNGKNCTDVKCGELPQLPPASGTCRLGNFSQRVGEIPQSLKDIISAASETYKTPPNLILGIMYGEGLFDGGNKKDWTDENIKNWSTCEKVPDCNETGDDNFMGFNGNDWSNISKNIEGDLKKLDPKREAPNQCNLLDAIYGLAWNLHDSADGGMNFSCFGFNLNATIPKSCDWDNNQYESAIKIAGSGYEPACLTETGSCSSGGGLNAQCSTGGDSCERIDHRFTDPSHNACVWDVGHGN